MKRLQLYTFLLIYAVAAQAALRDAELRRVSIDEGLAGDCVYSILRDSRGLTWVGTNNGVCLYDGQRVTPIACGVRRSTNLVNDLAELPDGSIVAAMRAGLFRIRPEAMVAERVLLPADAAGEGHITDVRSLLVRGDSLLIGSGSGLVLVPGLSSYTEGKQVWKAETVTLGSSRMARDNQIVDLCADGRGGVWVIGTSSLFHLDSQMHAARMDVDFGSVRDGLRSVCAALGQVYIGTSWQGLLRYDPARRMLTGVDAVPTGVVADLHSTPDGHLFVAMDGGGAMEIDTRTDSVIATYRHDGGATSLPTNSVYTFWRDARTGVAFFGFFRQGMAHSISVTPLVETYRCGDFDSRDVSVRSFCLHDTWRAIGTREGLWLADERTATTRNFSREALGGANVLSIAWAAGRFVVATFDGGLSMIEPTTGRVSRPDEPALRKGNFTKVAVIPASSDSLLMAISDHVVVMDTDFHIKAMYDSRNSGLTGSVMTDFLFDGTGKAWLSFSMGLALYDAANGVVQRTGFPAGFFNGEASMTFALDPSGDVLAANENNLYRSSPDLALWDSLDIASRLDVGAISFIAPKDGGYWIGTDRGLFRTDSTMTRFRHFGLAEGLPSLFCNAQSWQVDDKGAFWFSTNSGLHRISAGYEQTYAAPVFFQHVIIDGRQLPVAQALSVSTGRQISVGWNFGQETLEIKAIPLDYSDGRATYWEWCIDDGPMQVATERRPIRIVGLGLGRHRLHIFHPGETEAQTFTISVWPNLMFWFELLFVLLLMVSIPLMLQYQRRVARARALKKRKRALELELHAREAVKRHIEEEEQRRREAEEARKAAMYQRSRSSQEEYRKLHRALRTLMEDEHPYRQADLRVADVARALSSTPGKVSQMLSQYAGVSFYDFINDYRIEEFKRRAVDDKYNHLSTLAIAEMCGFKKTSFYAAFAKKEGCTPAEWLARQGRKR